MKTLETNSLFHSFTFQGLELKNRIVMAPMTRSRAIGSVPNEIMADYYTQRTSAGLIISEGTAPSANGIGYARTPGIYNQEQIEGWKQITTKVHDNGGKIFLQLMHVGRIAHPENQQSGARIIGPSAIAANYKMWTDTQGLQPLPVPEEATLADLEEIKKEFAKAASNAIKAGFDGVELHGANGYLLEQFLNPHANQRTDQYGGSIENRSRFVLEITDAVISAIGKEKVGIRFSPYSTFNDLPHYDEIFETYDYLTEQINQRGILYIHLVDYAALATEEGRDLVKRSREIFSSILIRNGGYNKERAQEVLENGEADLISFGTPFISNPDFPERIKKGVALNAPLPDFFYTPGEKGYIDYALA
jgi:N-ethylmaleimide reductase